MSTSLFFKLAGIFGALSVLKKPTPPPPTEIVTFSLPGGKGTAYQKRFKKYLLYVVKEKAVIWPWSQTEATEWHVFAYDSQGELVGQAHPQPSDGRRPTGYDPAKPVQVLEGAALGVKPKHQRQGLASAMYQFVEEVSALPIVPSTIFQTPQGKAFTAGRKTLSPSSVRRAATEAEQWTADKLLRKILGEIPSGL